MSSKKRNQVNWEKMCIDATESSHDAQMLTKRIHTGEGREYMLMRLDEWGLELIGAVCGPRVVRKKDVQCCENATNWLVVRSSVPCSGEDTSMRKWHVECVCNDSTCWTPNQQTIEASSQSEAFTICAAKNAELLTLVSA